MTNLLIEGWRDVSHSFALVNQCQILELLKLDGLRLFHRDMPYAIPHWNPKSLDAGFAPADRDRIASVPGPEGRPIDCVYRIASPFRAGTGDTEHVRTLSFMVTELGINDKNFEPPGSATSDFFTRDGNLIVTPTRWARDRIVEYGFDADKVHVVTHGVRSDTFYPLTAEERAVNRANLGIKEHEVAFLNLGAALWNKGVDLLVVAFARLRQRYSNIKLILKDQRALYGISIDHIVHDVAARHPGLINDAVLSSIVVIGQNLTQAQLRVMYGISDCYVSAYRAEGFNLPVLEAIAVGTPVVVTDGGATDDFCDADVSIRVASTPAQMDNPQREGTGRYREPNPDALIDAMHRFCISTGVDRVRFAQGRERLVERLSWRNAVADLNRLIEGPGTAPAAA
jgi:glycosyltransferase involved in cell wall biosynthesis